MCNGTRSCEQNSDDRLTTDDVCMCRYERATDDQHMQRQRLCSIVCTWTCIQFSRYGYLDLACLVLFLIAHAWMTGQPLTWTENEGWFEEWNQASDQVWDDRTPEDMANVIAKVFWLCMLCFV